MIKRWFSVIMPRWWMSSKVDENHPHKRRNSAQYLKRKLLVQFGWMILLSSLIIFNAGLAVILSLVLLGGVLSFMFLDEHR